MCRSFSFPVVIERLSVMQTLSIWYGLLYASHKKLSTKPTIKQKTKNYFDFDFWFCCCIILLYHILSCFLLIFSVNSNLLWIKVVHLVKDRSSRWRWSVIRFAFKDFANFTGKKLCGSPIFDKVTGGA